MSQTDRSLHIRTLDRIAYWTPGLAIVLLSLTYFLWPDFYLRFVIERRVREYQAVEILTLSLLSIGTVILFRATMDLWKLQGPASFFGPRMFRKIAGSGAWIVGLCCLAVFFFAGEEMNWGQTLFHWGVPEDQKPYQINIHNSFQIPLTIMQFGDIFLLLFFIVLPLLWRFRDRFGVPMGWGPAIPAWPVILSIIVASCWEKVKHLYIAANPDLQAAPSELYLNFFEELNEHKEMLFAFSFLMYGLYVRANWRASPGSDADPKDP